MTYNVTEARVIFEEVKKELAQSGFNYFLQDVCDETFRKWKRVFYDMEPDVQTGISICYGCSRLVIVPPNGDYVFKIQFSTEDAIDYCHNEEIIYGMASERGVEQFFAWTSFIGEYGEAQVYAMEKLEVDDDQNASDSYDYHMKNCIEDGEDEYYGEYDDHDGMIEYAQAHNGSAMDEAVRLIDEIGINDLHCGNWGYRGSTFVLVDYGGYRETLHLSNKR